MVWMVGWARKWKAPCHRGSEVGDAAESVFSRYGLTMITPLSLLQWVATWRGGHPWPYTRSSRGQPCWVGHIRLAHSWSGWIRWKGPNAWGKASRWSADLAIFAEGMVVERKRMVWWRRGGRWWCRVVNSRFFKGRGEAWHGRWLRWRRVQEVVLVRDVCGWEIEGLGRGYMGVKMGGEIGCCRMDEPTACPSTDFGCKLSFHMQRFHL